MITSERKVAREAGEYPVIGGENFSFVEREAARTALLTNQPQTFKFNKKQYVISPKDATQYFSKNSLRAYISKMRIQVGIMAATIFRLNSTIKKEIEFGKKIHGRTFRP